MEREDQTTPAISLRATRLLLGMLVLTFVAGCGPAPGTDGTDGADSAAVGGAGVERAAAELAEEIDRLGVSAVAVVDLTDLAGRPTELGRLLAGELAARLAGERRSFEVVDRAHLAQLLAEHRLAASGLLAEDAARAVGEVAGVDALVTGTVAPLDDVLQVSWKVLATETATVLAGTGTTLARTPGLDELARRPAADGFGARAGPSPSAALERAAADLAAPPSRVVEQRGFAIRLHRCRRETAGIACSFSIVNRKERERNLRLYFSSTRLVAPGGSAYPASVLVLGGREAIGDGQVAVGALQDEPVDALVLFEPPAPQATRAERVVLGVWGPDVSFRDVPID